MDALTVDISAELDGTLTFALAIRSAICVDPN